MKTLTVALIPARAGSQGVPGKNIKLLAGKPMIAYTIEAALGASNVDEVYVTTESDGIAEIAAAYGAKVLMRPEELATNTVQTDETYLFALRQLQLQGIEPAVLVLLQPTSPFRTSQHIERAVELFFEMNGHFTIFSGYREPGFYWTTDQDDEWMPIFHDPMQRMGRQGYDNSQWLLRENGALYITSAEEFSQYRCYRIPPFHCFEMTEEESSDVDSMKDWDRAVELMEKRK